MIKLVMILLGLTCTSFHQQSEVKDGNANECFVQANGMGEDVIHFNLFQSIIN